MSWGLVAVAGASLIVGGVSYKSSKDAAKANKEAVDAQTKSADEQMAMETKRVEEWTDVYGPMQNNLANYYSSVTPDYYAAAGLEAFEQENEIKMQNIDEMFAQRGIDPSSGLAVSVESQAELGAAETRAEIRRDAPRMAAEDQSRFLQIGLGQNPGSSLSNAMSMRTQQAGQRVQAAGRESLAADQAVGTALGAAIPTVGKAIDAYSNRPPTDNWSGTVANQGGSV